MPADRDLRGAKLAGVDLSGADLSNADLSNTDLSNTDLRNADLRNADLSGANLAAAALSGARLHGARGGRAVTVLFGKEAQMIQPLQQALQVGRPVVVALTAARALRLREVTVVNEGDLDCAKSMEVRTGPSADGPWTRVAAFTLRRRADERQTFAAAPDGFSGSKKSIETAIRAAPALAGFVQVVVLDTFPYYGPQFGAQAGGFRFSRVSSVELEGDAWGPAA